MTKEFCVDCVPCGKKNNLGSQMYTVKIKTGDEIIQKDIPLESIPGYEESLKDLGYKQTHHWAGQKNKAFDLRCLVNETRKELEDLYSKLREYEKEYEEAESAASSKRSICYWWYDNEETTTDKKGD